MIVVIIKLLSNSDSKTHKDFYYTNLSYSKSTEHFDNKSNNDQVLEYHRKMLQSMVNLYSEPWR